MIKINQIYQNYLIYFIILKTKVMIILNKMNFKFQMLFNKLNKYIMSNKIKYR